MKAKNLKAMENLSVFCHFAGVAIVFFGLLIAFMNFVNGEVKHIQSGVFIFISGYAFVKISDKISKIIFDEKDEPPSGYA